MKAYKKIMHVILCAVLLCTAILMPTMKTEARTKSILQYIQKNTYLIPIGLGTANLKEYIGEYSSEYTDFENSIIGKMYSFSSDNTDVASVDAVTGELTLKQTGNVVVTVKYKTINYKMKIKVIESDTYTEQAKQIVNQIYVLETKYASVINKYSGYELESSTLTDAQAIQMYNDCAVIEKASDALAAEYEKYNKNKQILILVPNKGIFDNEQTKVNDYFLNDVDDVISYKLAVADSNKAIKITAYRKNDCFSTKMTKMTMADFERLIANGNLKPDSIATQFSSMTYTFKIYKACSKCGGYHSSNLYATVSKTVRQGDSAINLKLPKALGKGTYYVEHVGKIVVK